jgi:hypothetical protein
LAVDEIIVLFKGRVIFKQYILKKNKWFGINIYKLCDSKGVTKISPTKCKIIHK